jgi:UDP:flavonoid glycosyltransferase YjiC (YdhE family)
MKFLLLPNNNSLSHIAKCLSIKDCLIARDHEVSIAVSNRHSEFLGRLGCEHHVLPDIQESDEAGFPTFDWFRKPKRIADCIRAEVDLLKKLRPDRVLGVFRFTIKASAQIADVPYDSLVCGCMLPDSMEVLGFARYDPGIETQKEYLDTFFRYAGGKTSCALKSLGLPEIDDIRHFLKGERTFLWDFPEFMPLPHKKDIIHVGPITMNQWPSYKVDIDTIFGRGLPLAVVSFGTCVTRAAIVERIVQLLLELGYQVLVAAGGQKELLNVMPSEQLVTTCLFAPLNDIFPKASLLVSHGGQMTVFESLYNKVPVVVMPSHPEQAHSGVCLERIGCGKRLIPPQLFISDPGVYINEFNRMGDDELLLSIDDLANNPQTPKQLAEISEVISKFKGAETIASMLEEG